MADSQSEIEEISREGKRLKYLNFVIVYEASLLAVVFLVGFYEFAKESTGPLKPGVRSAERAVKAAIGPVFEKFRGVPFDVLEFADRKVGDLLTEVDRHVPTMLKSASTQTYTAAQKAPEVARSLAGEVQRSGLVATASGVARDLYVRYEPVAKDAYVRYEPVAEGYAVAAWRSLNRLPLFPQVAQIIVPTTGYWAEKYNKAVSEAVERDHPVARYLPAVPIERIAKVFGEQVERPSVNGSDAQPATAE